MQRRRVPVRTEYGEENEEGRRVEKDGGVQERRRRRRCWGRGHDSVLERLIGGCGVMI